MERMKVLQTLFLEILKVNAGFVKEIFPEGVHTTERERGERERVRERERSFIEPNFQW